MKNENSIRPRWHAHSNARLVDAGGAPRFALTGHFTRTNPPVDNRFELGVFLSTDVPPGAIRKLQHRGIISRDLSWLNFIMDTVLLAYDPIDEDAARRLIGLIRGIGLSVESLYFHPGQKVVCVSDEFSQNKDWRRRIQQLPKLYETYEIREICREGDKTGFLLSEIKNPVTQFSDGAFEAAFDSKNFRILSSHDEHRPLVFMWSERTPDNSYIFELVAHAATQLDRVVLPIKAETLNEQWLPLRAMLADTFGPKICMPPPIQRQSDGGSARIGAGGPSNERIKPLIDWDDIEREQAREARIALKHELSQWQQYQHQRSKMSALRDARAVDGGTAVALAHGAHGDEVDSSVFAPAAIAPGGRRLIQVFLHVPADASKAKEMAQQANLSPALRQITRSLSQPIARGSQVDIFLEADGLEIDGSISNSLIWNGRPITADFILRSPQQGFRNEYFPTVRIAVNGELIGRITFTLACNISSSVSTGRCTGTATPYRKAFLSYSSKDRVEVLKRAQSLRLAKIDIFQDVLTLQPADRWSEEILRHVDECDLFLLFWSRSAKESEWVEKEVKYALDKQKQSPDKLPDIIPVIIEGPPPVAPPGWLSHLHFNDPICYFIAGSV